MEKGGSKNQNPSLASATARKRPFSSFSSASNVRGNWSYVFMAWRSCELAVANDTKAGAH